jgi:hypothetical protein
MSDNLPDNAGYVAAAYLVFVALLLIYLAIAAIRSSRLERELLELNQLAAEQAKEQPEPVGDAR